MPFRAALSVSALSLATLAAAPALASTCADPNPELDLEQRVADCEADLSWVWDRSGFPHLVFNQGRALRLLGRTEDALPLLHEALGYSPDSALYWAELGRLYLALKEPGTSAAMFGQAAALDPVDPYAPADRAEAWFTLGRADACVADLDAALPRLKGLQDEAWFYNLRGRCLAALGRQTEAIADFDTAGSVYPGYIDAAGNRVYALHAAGRYDEALAASAPLLDPAQTPDLSPEWAFGLRALRIEALGFLGRAAEAGAEIDALRTAHAGTLDLANLEAWALFTAGKVDQADRAADALRNAPDQGQLAGFMLDTVAQIDLALGRTDKALAGLELAAWRDPGLARGWIPALAKQGYLPQTRFADGVLTAVRRCISELAAKCSLAPLPVTTATPVTVARPAPVPPPPADAPAETPAFEPAPAGTPETPPEVKPPDLPGLGAPPRAVRPAAP